MILRAFVAVGFCVCGSLLAESPGVASPLADSPSAFLRAHADSPVRWRPWERDAFARAQAEQKPVFLAIGSFTSELSRAMREQSFARPETAALLNEHFVCVLVDRDERRDVADLFETYVRVVKQMDGWPLNVWLTPDLKPFDGATYLPPSDEWGKEGLPKATRRVLAAWQADPEAQRKIASEAVEALAAARVVTPTPSITPAELDQLLIAASESWRSRYDSANGGFGDPPKFPEPELLRYLLKGDSRDRELALRTLRALAASGLRDPLDGGFFRYAIDAEWRLPAFQKTLDDQARLALAYLDAGKVSGDTRFVDSARAALAYALTLGEPGAGLSAAEDATREDLAASFLWTYNEIAEVLGPDTETFSGAFGVRREGNLAPDVYPGIDTAGKNVLRRANPPGTAEAERRLELAAARLRTWRHRRPPPLQDGIAAAGTHGLLLSAMARAGAELPDERFAAAAQTLYVYIRDKVCAPDGTLRAFPGRSLPATPGDCAHVFEALSIYSGVTGDKAARELASALRTAAMARFWDKAASRFFAPASDPELFARVHVPGGAPGDPPRVEAAWLFALATYWKDGDTTCSELAGAIAADIRAAAGAAGGDQLLALQAFANKR